MSDPGRVPDGGGIHAEGEFVPVGDSVPPVPLRPRRAAVVAMAVMAVVLAAVAGAVVGGRPPGITKADPVTLLDRALASGTPAYVLVHSST